LLKLKSSIVVCLCTIMIERLRGNLNNFVVFELPLIVCVWCLIHCFCFCITTQDFIWFYIACLRVGGVDWTIKIWFYRFVLRLDFYIVWSTLCNKCTYIWFLIYLILHYTFNCIYVDIIFFLYWLCNFLLEI